MVVDPYKPELHASGFRAILEVASNLLGADEVSTLVQSLGVKLDELSDPNGWFSLEFAETMINEITARTGDATWLDRAMRLGVTPKYLGILWPLFRSFGTPAFTYKQTVSIVQRLNKTMTWQLEALGSQYARFRAHPAPNASREKTPIMCRVRLVQLGALATMFDLPPATTEHPECLHRGGSACVYEVRWKEHRRPLWSLGGLATALGLGVAGSFAWGLPAVATWSWSLGLGLGGWALARTWEMRRDLRNRIEDLTESHDALTSSTLAHEQRYAELAQAKAEVEDKVEQRTRELREATQRLSETLNEIQALDRAKTDFFNNVSHELRSPLTLILAPLEDLAAGRNPPAGERAAFESMRRNAARLLNLINQLLDMAKIDAGQMEITPTPTDVGALLRSVLTGFEAAAQKKGVHLELRVRAAPAPLVLDVSWIESAVNNLVANALRFTSPGGYVRIGLEDEGSHVTISVADDGPGIAAADQDKVFARFAQGDSSKKMVGGTGIGLALVREAARLHGGDVKLSSELGKGSTFTLTLPRRLELQPSAHAVEAQAPSTQSRQLLLEDISDRAHASDRPGPTANAPLALVVEDNPELREFMADELAVRYRVRTASDGRQALVLAGESKPDVVVSDVAMPEMDGYALCRALRQQDETQSVPVLLVTARTDIASVLEGFDAGANDYVLKPFHGRELIARVDVHVRLRRMVQELALRERHAMLGVLAASVAHQVRNPLTTLVSGLPAMRNRIKDKVDPSTRDLIDVMIDCASRIERLTIDLMDLSRVDRETAGSYRPCDGLRASLRMLRARVAPGVAIEEQVEDSGAIQGRPGDMNHVFLNLLDNAVRAVGASGRIRVDAQYESSAYVVRVGDSGPGIDSETAQQIFEPFFTTRPAGEGTGLGLAIARQVVQQAGGQIEVGSSPLGGAEFTVRLPMSGRRSVPAPQLSS
jgi:signal transduction histidine kinase